MTCTFFGHRDFSAKNIGILREVVADLIKNHGVNEFFVGHQGNFDKCVVTVLREMKVLFPHIKYAIVLSTIEKDALPLYCQGCETMVFEDFGKVPPKFRIARRNLWMLKKSDWVVGYIVRTHTTGGAAQYFEMAQKQKKNLINIAN